MHFKTILVQVNMDYL